MTPLHAVLIPVSTTLRATPRAPDDWFESFSPFGLFHLAVLAVGAICIATPVYLGLRWRDDRERVLRAWVGWSTLVAQALMLIYYIRPSRFVLTESLPLHICDLAGWIGGAALVTQRRWLRTLTYYWAFGLCTQAFFTPIITQGLAHTKFWLYWLNHMQIVGCAVYDLVVLRYRPAWSDFFGAARRTFVYAILLMVPFNWFMHTNYAYTGPSQPSTPTLMDELGAWPLRLVWIMLLAIAIFTIITLPWTLARRFARRPDTDDA